MHFASLSDEVGDFFEPSVMAAVASIKAQIDASEGVVDVCSQYFIPASYC